MLFFFFGAIFFGLKSAFQDAKESAKRDRQKGLERFQKDLDWELQAIRQGERLKTGEGNGSLPNAQAKMQAWNRGDFGEYFS